MLAVGDAFTLTPKGPRFVKEDARTYRTAGGIHRTHCDGERAVYPVASVATPCGIDRLRTIIALRKALDALTRNDYAAVQHVIGGELSILEKRPHR